MIRVLPVSQIPEVPEKLPEKKLNYTKAKDIQNVDYWSLVQKHIDELRETEGENE